MPAEAAFNPLQALQTLLQPATPAKHRVKAAQQLEQYFRLLTPTPTLLLSYEPYLPLLAAELASPTASKGAQELQPALLALLLALSNHNPTGFSDWIAGHASMGNEPWLVQWSYALLLQTEKQVDGGQWNEGTAEFIEFDTVLARVLQMWRTLLDHTADVALVDQLVKYIHALLFQQEEAERWHELMLKKLQTHFVDIADVLVGWMMSTGPMNPLREEILTLLNHFGRLWADNSVFSLQLLNSFADEIVSLCDGWNEHQEGDDDRISTLLACFMMVAQCVPDLALPADDDAESPFARVLQRVEACPQPEYSLFCLANCSEYLVSISSRRSPNFPPLSVSALRFLLYHCAVQSRLHDSEIEKLTTILKNACKLANANFSIINGTLLGQSAAKGVLEDEIPVRAVKKGTQSKRVKVMECLFHTKCPNGVTYITQLCLQLVRLGQISALKVLGTRALQGLNGRTGEKGTSFFVFAATCFILASRTHEALRHAHDGIVHVIAILELFAAKLEKQNRRYRQHKLTPRQLCLVLKMASAFVGAIRQGFADREDIVEAVNRVSIQMLECAASMLPKEAVAVRDHRLVVDMLKVIETVLSRAEVVRVIPRDTCRSLLKEVSRACHSSSVKIRAGCVQVLKALSCRAEAVEFAGDMFEMSLDLVLDPSGALQGGTMSEALSGLAQRALLSQEKLHTPRHIVQPLHPSFDAADFENIIRLFKSCESDGSEWNRVCRQIMGRTDPGATFSNSEVLLGAIRQAATWCVQNRLRTHFGGPAQTFASMERLLLEYSGGVEGLAGWTSQAARSSMVPPNQLSKWLVLEFVSALEICIVHAICTTDSDQNDPESEANKTVLFFRTNKGVCDDWLNRIRPLLLDMSRHGTSYELCRYHSHALMTTCYSRLTRAMAACSSRGLSAKSGRELKQAEKDMDIALYLLCRCYCDAKDADSIIGFEKWGHSISSALSNWYQLNDENANVDKQQWETPLFRWLSAVRYEAEMRYEDAIAEYESILQPVLESKTSKPSVGTAKLFASPMAYLRLSPPVLVGCFKHCAKCYAGLREWTKLRQFVMQFSDMVQCLADSDQPIEGIQSILDCTDLWSDEMGTISSLETIAKVPATDNELDNCSTKRAALALRVWGAFNDTNGLRTNAVSHVDNVGLSRLKTDLIPLAMQPAPWIGYAGESIGKKAEEILLRMFGLTKGVHYAGKTVQNEALVRLDHEMYDSALWSQPFCTPSSTQLRGDRQSEFADADCYHLARVASLARRQHNFGLARRLLSEASGLKGTTRASAMAVIYEKAKLLETIGMEDEGRRILETQCESSLASIATGNRPAEENDLTVRSLLHLASTLSKSDAAELSSPATSRFLDDTVLDDESAGDNILRDLVDDALSSDVQDMAAHKCLQSAVKVSPNSGRAWIQYSNWCYGRGKQELAQITEQNGYIHLNSSDEIEIHALLDQICVAEKDRDLVIRSFCHFLDNGELLRQREDIFHQMCIDRAPPNPDNDAMNRLIQLQRVCHAKVLTFYCMAARGYGKYLSVLLSDDARSSSKQQVTMVALRLLGLLTAYGSEGDVVSALEEVFSEGPVMPWSYVVPQLLARVHHPIPGVSSRVCLILRRLVQHSPHVIVYPAVVDSMEPQIVPAALQEGQITFAAVLQELKNVSSGQTEGVRLLVSELRRISILWDEAWISTLMKLSTDVARRTTTLEKEATRVHKNASLSAKEKNELAQRKLVAIMKPILVSLEKLWKETCGGARDQPTLSPHERKFLKDQGCVIEKALSNFRLCCNAEVRASPVPSTKTPQELWQPFTDILKSLLNASGRRDQLPLQDISPAMASTSRQLVLTNMPGASSGQSDPVTIQRVDPSVAVLRTKTKPKALEFIGSDGQTYKYLLKAREDLRLDERIMQFLSVTNDFLSADSAAAARDLSAKNYSVIPLSRNAGLIQMVPDVVPLFQVYTSRNETQAVGSAAVPDSGPASSTHQSPPPTAQFYAKLKQHGIENVSPNHRAQWPVPVLKQVYQELVAQRPRNVLQQEILLRSEDLREGWTKTTRFSRSLAVMSVLGYVVGLGDRHLDNILLCINSGDVVHIDHNVCFDKGRRLKVPEVVPFRLTPMLQDALGFTGVEGKFRVAFETTLRIVRSDDVREALLTLFEAFVYSPLVDWIAEDKRQGRSGDLKARLEVNVNLSLFLSRAEERRQDTVSFGRQYEQFTDALSLAFKSSGVPFVALLDQRKRFLSLENEEQVLLKAAATAGAELSTYRSLHQEKRAEVEAAAAQAKEVAAKLTSFANECLARHQQIEVWRQKSINFAETGPETEMHAVAKTAESASFQKAHAILNKVLEESQFAGQYSELLAALESKCRAVDTDVMRLRFEIERLATCLIPYLSAYGHWRMELDAYLNSEFKMPGKDVYLTWWNRCTQSLQRLVGGQDENDTASVTNWTTAPSQESIAESVVVLQRLSGVSLHGSTCVEGREMNADVQEDSPFFSDVDGLLQDVASALSALNLSNAQGQRLMKLAGASWMIEAIEKLVDGVAQSTSADRFVDGAFTPMLAMSSGFQQVVAVAHACGTLLELVSTPKGSMKRLRSSELLAVISERHRARSGQDAAKPLDGFIGILQTVGSLAVVLQEELISNLHARRWDETAHLELADGVAAILATHGDVAHGFEDNSSLQTVLAEHPGARKVFTAALAVVQKISALVDALHEVAVMTDEEAGQIKRLSSVSWIELVLNFTKLATLSEANRQTHAMENDARVAWCVHMDDFVPNCLVKLLRYQLSSIISFEWKFDFVALGNEQNAQADDVDESNLSAQWAVFFSSQIPDVLPSALTSQRSETPEVQVDAVRKSVTQVITACETWWAQQWKMVQSKCWVKKVSSLRKHHERRLRYATWLAVQPGTETKLIQVPTLTRVQLLTFLSSQLPHLNALLMDQVTVEASVLELAHQMNYLASTVSAAPQTDQQAANESPSDCIQSCYGKVAALFEYGRTLADLVQGISVIETSTDELLPGTAQVELEVNAVGKNLLEEAASAAQALALCSKAADAMDTHLLALQDEMKRRQAAYDLVASSKRSADAELQSVCAENEGAVFEVSRALRKYVTDMRYVLKGFDKFKTPSKQNQAGAGLEHARRDRQLQSQRDSGASGRSSPKIVAEFFFMENDRLVKILLRSIRSVNHLPQLEGVLERHGEVCAALRAAVTRIDQALRDFEIQADQLLAVGAQDMSATGYRLLQLLLDLMESLLVETSDRQSDADGTAMVESLEEPPAPLLIMGRDLVRGCVKLFFEATEMADRFSSAEDEGHRAGAVASSADDEAEGEEQQGGTGDPTAALELEVENSSSDSGSGSQDATVATPQAVEEKSQYGLRVLKRIEEKLSGTVTEMAHSPPVLTVEQQASWLIDEATKTDNLCVMYEGWTPWI